jgi:hypothetical protein
LNCGAVDDADLQLPVPWRLAIVRAIMARHDRNVALTSSPAGTCFTLGWPRGGAEVDPDALPTSL